MGRITTKMLETKVAQVSALLGFSLYLNDYPANRPGRYRLDYVADPGRTFGWSSRRKTAQEMSAYLDGMYDALALEDRIYDDVAREQDERLAATLP